MIEIEYYEKNGRYAISAKGHANYAPEGQDIVCAAVSSLLQTLGNYLLEHAQEDDITILEVKFEKGDLNIEAIEDYYINKLEVPYTMTKEGLEDIAEIYPGYVKITCKSKIDTSEGGSK